ncbi:WGR domain-containing protein, partial [Micromonospora sp. CPCC 205711]|uniref:WGR domain-containing protein n=1 Tax=Micromonospora sp. CPCC 205547 TaxID=3122400 RepID=UPI002FF3C2EF
MRRFDCVSGSAAKFWEVESADLTVTVRYGRTGSAGRIQVKEFGSATEAAEHADRLIAEKLRKGYVEAPAAPTSTAVTAAPATSAVAGEPGTTGPMSAADGPTAPPTPAGPPAEALPDEETFVVPAGWRRHLLPRRDGLTGAVLPRGAKARKAGEELLASLADGVDRLLGNSDDAELVGAVRAHLAGERTPLGAAGLLVAVGHEIAWRDTDRGRDLADLLVADDGVVAAARAVIESIGIRTEGHRDHHRCVLARAGGGAADWGYRGTRLAVLGRVRAHLAVATDDEYAAARAALVPYRQVDLANRVVTSFLLPTEADWVAEDVPAVDASGDRFLAELMMNAAPAAEDFARMADRLGVHSAVYDPAAVVTAAATVGPSMAPLLADWFDHEYVDAAGRQRLVSLLAAFPTDEAMRLLLDRLDQKYVQAGVLEMLRRFPVRGVRLLARAAGGRTAAARDAATLLRGHVLTNPAAVAAALPLLDSDDRQRVTQIHADRESLTPATPDRLPPVLVSPPWLARRHRTAPPVVAGLVRPDEAAIAWLPGERERWAATRVYYMSWWRQGEDLSDLAPTIASGRYPDSEGIAFFTRAPEAVARPLVRSWRPRDTWDTGSWLPRVVGRLELDALPAALHVSRSSPQVAAGVLLPYTGGEVADLMADWLDRLKSARPAALAWFHRHPAAAARALLPAALGPAGP